MDLQRILVNRAVIEGQGVPREQATRLAIVPSVVDMPLTQSLVLAFAVGRKAAPAPAPAEPPHDIIKVPELVGDREEAARRKATGFRIAIEGTPDGKGGKIVSQEPPAGTKAEPGSRLVLVIGAPQQGGPAAAPNR